MQRSPQQGRARPPSAESSPATAQRAVQRAVQGQQYAAQIPLDAFENRHADFFRGTAGTGTSSSAAHQHQQQGTGVSSHHVHYSTATPSEYRETTFDESRQNVEQIYTDQLIIEHARAILILACIKLCVGVQIGVFGLICWFYDGCPYATGIWTGCIFATSAVLGILFVKAYSRYKFLIIYLVTTTISALLSVALFGVTVYLLDREEAIIRGRWDYVSQRYSEMNRIVENTKISMFALELVLAPVIGLCCVTTLVLLCLNLNAAVRDEMVKRAYYVAKSPVGHQMMLVPVDVKTMRRGAPYGATGSGGQARLPAGMPPTPMVSVQTQTTSAGGNVGYAV